jgi:hypothetical protein
MAKQKAKQSERVLEMVRRELAKQPDISSGDLFAMARKLDRSVRPLSLRQFHALYPLQVKRAEKAALRSAKKGTRRSAARTRGASRTRVPGAPGSAPDREAIRVLLLDFAGAVAAAESKAEVLKLVGEFDTWIDRVLKAST